MGSRVQRFRIFRPLELRVLGILVAIYLCRIGADTNASDRGMPFARGPFQPPVCTSDSGPDVPVNFDHVQRHGRRRVAVPKTPRIVAQKMRQISRAARTYGAVP